MTAICLFEGEQPEIVVIIRDRARNGAKKVVLMENTLEIGLPVVNPDCSGYTGVWLYGIQWYRK